MLLGKEETWIVVMRPVRSPGWGIFFIATCALYAFMGPERRVVLAALALLIVAIALVASIRPAFRQPAPYGNYTSVPGGLAPSTTVPAQTTTVPQNAKYIQVFGVVVHDFYAQTNYSMGQGVKEFRTGLYLDPVQEAEVANETRTGASYLGITGAGQAQGWTLSDYNGTLGQEIAAYPEVQYLEVLNEPWSTKNQDGFNNGSAYNYFLIIRSTYLLSKAANPNITLVCFGGAAIDNASERLWYSQVWGYGASKYCDAVSIHAYTGNGRLLNATGRLGQTLAQNWAQDLYWYENLTGKPIWITETGQISDVLTGNGPRASLVNQSLYLNQSFSLFASLPFVKRVYWYDLYGISDAPIDRDFGLLNLSTSLPKPAWYTFLGFYRNGVQG